MHEPSIRVPLQIRYPKRIPTGIVRSEMVLDTDLAPTFLDLAGVPIPSHIQGKSVLPLAQNPDADFRKEWLYEYYEYPNPENVAVHRGIRTERYKLIHYYKDVPEAFELYDLKLDPGEQHNLYSAAQYEQLLQHLQTRLKELQAAIPERREAS